MDAYRNFSREGLGPGKMASEEREPIMGYGELPAGSRAGRQSPWSAVHGAKSPKAESTETFVRLKEGKELCCR